MRNGPKRCRKYFCTMITVSLINASSDCSSGVSVGSAVEFGDLLVLPLASAPALTPLLPPSGCDGVSPSFAARGACRSAMLRRLCAVAVSTMMGYANQTTAAETIAHLLQVYRRGDRHVKKRIEMREGLHRKEKRADEILMFLGMLFLPPKHGEGVRGVEWGITLQCGSGSGGKGSAEKRKGSAEKRRNDRRRPESQGQDGTVRTARRRRGT